MTRAQPEAYASAMSDTGGQAPRMAAGWYRDPRMANTLRFWDGQQWTPQTQPIQPPRVNWWSWEAIVGIFLIAPAVLLVLVWLFIDVAASR